jgi:hypothetical protein
LSVKPETPLSTFVSSLAESQKQQCNGPCHVSGIFLPLRVNSLPLATIYEVKIPLRKWKKSLLQRNPAQMTWHNDSLVLWGTIFGHSILKMILRKLQLVHNNLMSFHESARDR